MNLSSLIRETALNYQGQDTQTIARHVLEQIDPSDYQEALLTLLNRQIPTELSRQRQATRSDLQNIVPQVAGNTSLQDPRLLQRIEAYMDALVPVDGRNIRRGDLTADDCRFLYQRNYDHAQATMVTANGYKRLADTLDTEHKTRLDELDGQLVKDVLDGRA